jgi:hypothetical protein
LGLELPIVGLRVLELPNRRLIQVKKTGEGNGNFQD